MMKSLKMSKVLGSIKKKTPGGSKSASSVSIDLQGDAPEAIAGRNVKAFCESGGPNSGDEITFLPPIVDAAESSPAAAAECARVIRHFLKKDYTTKPSYQYNAIMLIRILADNPGPTFTRNVDEKFVKTVKDVLKTNDLSVYQMIVEMLEAFENTKAYDEGLALLLSMWKQEKRSADKDAQKRFGGQASRSQQQQQPQSQNPQQPQPRTLNAPAFDSHSQNYFARSHSNRRLPNPVELASRLEEARTSATLLHQVVSSTPPNEVLQNDLIKEFADRCLSASRSIQGYMSAADPAPDNDTMESLIDTNEQLQASLSLHQRAMLNARKQTEIGAWSADVSSLADNNNAAANNNQYTTNISPTSSAEDPYNVNGGSGNYGGGGGGGSGSLAPTMPSRSAKPKANGKGKEREYEPAAAGPSRSQTPLSTVDDENPFRDPEPDRSGASRPSGSGSAAAGATVEPRLAFEPFHPGFGNTTNSYMGRQESAVGKEAMHGGAGSGGSAAAGGANNSHTLPPPPPPHDQDDDSDIYGTEGSKQKEPMYRY